MAAEVAVRLFNVNDGGGTLNSKIEVSLPFVPVAVELWINGRTETGNGIGASDMFEGYGAASGPSVRYCYCSSFQNGADPMNTNQTLRDDCAIVKLNAAGSATDGRLDLSSFTKESDSSVGCTFVIDEVFGTNVRVMAMFYGGDVVAKVVPLPIRSTTGNFAISGLGFEPTGYKICCVNRSSFNSIGGTPITSVGAAGRAGTGSSWVFGTASQDGAGTSVEAYYNRIGEVIGLPAANGAGISNRATHVSWDSDGVTLNYAEIVLTSRLGFLLFVGGCLAWSPTFNTTNGGTANIVLSGLGGQARGYFIQSVGRGQSALDQINFANEWGVGLSDGTVHTGMFRSAPSSQAVAAYYSAIRSDSAYIRALNSTTYGARLTHNALGSNGLTLSVASADNFINMHGVFAIGDYAVTKLRVTTGYGEAVHAPDVAVRATAGYSELIHSALVPTRITAGYVEAIFEISIHPRVTTAYAEAIVQQARRNAGQVFYL